MKKYRIIIAIVLIMIVLIAGYLINRKGSNAKINYEIIPKEKENYIEGTKSKYKRGYEVIEKDNEYYLIIYGGERTSTDELEVLNVETKRRNVKVTVRIIEGYGDAFSYPRAIIKFDKKPNKVNVIYK